MNSIKKYNFLFLGSNTGEEVCWARHQDNGRLAFGRGSLNEVAGRLHGEKVVVVVPGVDVLLTEVSFCGKRSRFVKRSIPFTLEEELAEDIDDLHFASGPVSREGIIPVAVVARSQMEKWCGLLQESGIEASYLIPETMAIPLAPDKWSLVLTADFFILRKSIWHGCSGDPGSLPLYLAGSEESVSLQEPYVQLFLDDCPAEYQQNIPAEKISSTNQQSLIEIIGDNFKEKEVINLLQGDFSRHAGWRDLWKNWQLPVIAAILLCLIGLAGFGLDYSRLRNENDALRDRIKAVYLKTFPGSRRVVNARAQMEQKLVELQQNVSAQNSFFEIYDKAVPLLLQTPGFAVNNFRYNNGRFYFDIDVLDFQALDKLKSDLTETLGDVVDIKNAEAAGKVVKAKIQIRTGEK